MGIKPGDNYTVPLDYREHERQHKKGELSYWDDIDAAIELAKSLYENTGNREKCLNLILNFRIKNNSTF